MLDLIVIGAGPAGIAAAVYAARKQLKTVLVAEEIGGQSVVSLGIENWIGTPEVAGPDLARMFKEHLDAVKGTYVELVLSERVTRLAKVGDDFAVTTESGKTFRARAVLVATGAARRKLGIPGAEKFENKGVTYCASCDGPLFAGQDVAVVGGGNAGFETALQLLAYAKSVTLFHRHKDFKADAVTVEKARAHPNMKIIAHAEPVEIMGEQFVTGMKYLDKDSGETKDISVTGIFAEVGVIPSTGFAEGMLELDPIKRVKVDPRNQRARIIQQTPPMAAPARRGESGEEDVRSGTATETQGPRNEAGAGSGGVWAAGDCTDELYHQNNIAAGDGVKALEDIYLWLKTR